MISNLTYALTQVVNITSSRINEVAAIAGTNEIEISNTSANSVPISITDVLGDNTILEWLQAIHQAVDTLELNVDNIENISLNTGDLEALQGSDAGAGNGDLSGYTYDSTNNLLTDVRTALQLLDDAVVAAAATISGTTRYNLMAGTDGTNAVPLKTDASGNVQTDIVAELPTGANAIGKLAANDGVDIGDVDVTSLPSAQIGETDQANSMSVTLATDDELLKTVDQSNNLVKVSSPTATNFNVTEANSTSIKTAVEKLDDTVNGNNQLDVNIAAGGFDGALTASTAEIGKLAAGTAAIGSVEVTAMPSTVNTSQVQSAVYTKQYTVTNTAAQVWGASSQATASGLTVLADSANTATVHVGPSGVSATTGIPLAAGAAFTFSIDDANKIYAICATANQKLNLVAM